MLRWTCDISNFYSQNKKTKLYYLFFISRLSFGVLPITIKMTVRRLGKYAWISSRNTTVHGRVFTASIATAAPVSIVSGRYLLQTCKIRHAARARIVVGKPKSGAWPFTEIAPTQWCSPSAASRRPERTSGWPHWVARVLREKWCDLIVEIGRVPSQLCSYCLPDHTHRHAYRQSYQKHFTPIIHRLVAEKIRTRHASTVQ